DVALDGVAARAAAVFAEAALAAAIERGDGKAERDVGQLFDPVAAIGGVAVELQDGGMRRGRAFWPQVFGVDAAAADAGEKQMKAICERRGELRGPQLDLRIDGVHLGVC